MLSPMSYFPCLNKICNIIEPKSGHWKAGNPWVRCALGNVLPIFAKLDYQ